MSATFDYGQYTVNGKTVHLKWLEAGIDEVTVRYVGNSTCGESDFYGVNAAIFNMNTDKKLITIAIQNGSKVADYGDQNGQPTTSNLGNLVRLVSPLTDGTFIFESKFGKFPTTQNEIPVYQSNVKWALGGISLLLNQNLTESQYYSAISDEWNLSNTSEKPRTAIGYKGGLKVILCAIFDGDNLWSTDGGANLWDVRTIMKNKFGCTMGVNLDGGGSTQISYKLNGQDCYHETEHRKIQSMVTVPM